MTKELFCDIYLSGEYEDPHTELSLVLRISRPEAKVELYRWLYSNSFFKTLLKDTAKGAMNDTKSIYN